MRIFAFLLIVVVGLAPFAVFASAVVISGGVKWQPPVSWETTFVATDEPSGGIRAVAADKTGLYVAGGQGPSSTGYSFLKKFDFNGRELWSHQIGLMYDYNVATLDVGSDGLYLTGFHSGNDTVFMEKHDLNGSIVWSKVVDSVSKGYSWGASVSASGLYIAGVNVGRAVNLEPGINVRSYDLNGNVVWTRSLANETSAIRDPFLKVFAASNSVYLAGSDPSLYNRQGFLDRYDTAGAQVWSRHFDNPPDFICDCSPFGLSGDGSGVYVGGYTNRVLQGETPFSGGGSFLRKYDLNGSIVWTTGRQGDLINRVSASQFGIFLTSAGVAAQQFSLERYDENNGDLVWGPVPTQGDETAYAVGGNGVYTGGTVDAGGTTSLLVGYDQSASLVLGGVNPPYSFLLGGLVLGTMPMGIILARWGMMKKIGRLRKSVG